MKERPILFFDRARSTLRDARSDGSYGYDTGRSETQAEAQIEVLEDVLRILRGAP